MLKLERLSHRSAGIFSASEWLEEGDGLLASARTLRATWLWKTRAFARRVDAQDISPRHWSEVKGLPRASALLIGYAVEMYLKAGLVQAYQMCSQAMFARDVRKFGHDLLRAAGEINLPNMKIYADDLRWLKTLIVGDARYPITPEEVLGTESQTARGTRYANQVNQRTFAIWNRVRFHQLCALAVHVRNHAARIDRDDENPAIIRHGEIGENGYWVFRTGGHLAPRVTFRLCASLPDYDKSDVQQNVESDIVFSATATWNGCTIREDTGGR